MSDICKINVSILKSYEKDFKSELNNFNNKTYTTFSSSYLKNCSDAYVRRMSNELQTLYDKVKKGYQNIDKWWVDYNANVEGLENYLSDNGSAGAISESSIRNSVNQLPNLKKYNLKFAGIIPASMVGTSYNTAFANNSVVSAVDPFSSLYSDYRVSEVNASKVVNNDNVVDQIDEAISTASASVVSWAKNIGSNINNFFVSTGAKISSFGETVVSKASEVIEDVDNLFDETKAYVANKAESLWDKTTEWWNDTTQKVDNWFDEVGTNISNGAKSLWADVTDWWSDVEDWWNDDAIPWIQNAANAVWDVVKSVGATVAVFVQSLVEGILQFGEAIIDFVALVGTGVASIVTGLIDGGQAIYGAITGNEWSSVTKQMWGGTMGFVSNQYVSGWFDLLYQNTGYGQWLAENAYGFDITRSIGSGIGYIAGVVVLTIATFGAGSVVAAGGSVTASTAAAATTATQMAVTATAAGIGRGTQNAWADGADLLEGLAAGTLTGLWEGLQFYVGGKISGLNIFGTDGILKSIGSSGLGTKLLNGLARVVLDGADGGVEGFVLPLITSIYKDGYYDENGNYVEFSDDQNIFERYSEVFDDNGGWTTVWTQASIGSATSLLGELFDLRKYFKDSKNKPNINISEQELQVKIDRYNELLDIKNSEDYLSYMDNAKKGYAQELKLEFEGIEKEFATLESELSLIAGIASETDVDISAIMDDVETEKLFDYDSNQPTVDLFATEKIVPEVEATLDMFATEKIISDNTKNANATTSVSNQPTAHLSFSKEYAESIKQLSDYYGDAGGNINNMFLQGKTAKQILDELDGQAKIDFQNFLQNTRQGQYLASLSDAEIHSMTTYTGGSYKEINGMLRQENISGTIHGMDAQRLIDNMDAAIAKYGGLEASTEIYRAVGVSAFTSQNSTYAALFNGIDVSDLNQVYSVLKVLEGKDFGDLGYMSTSPAYSASFAKFQSYPIVLDIIADEGTSGAYINQISNFYNSENEFLLARDTVLQMVEVLAPEKDINGLEKIVVRCVVK